MDNRSWQLPGQEGYYGAVEAYTDAAFKHRLMIPKSVLSLFPLEVAPAAILIAAVFPAPSSPYQAVLWIHG